MTMLPRFQPLILYVSIYINSLYFLHLTEDTGLIGLRCGKITMFVLFCKYGDDSTDTKMHFQITMRTSL